jgi:MerR family transcriptional regulator, mercuric resistance operon regulatory protein
MACARVKSITELHIADLRRKINELNRLDHELSALLARCRGDETPECPILGALAAPIERG